MTYIVCAEGKVTGRFTSIETAIEEAARLRVDSNHAVIVTIAEIVQER